MILITDILRSDLFLFTNRFGTKILSYSGFVIHI